MFPPPRRALPARPRHPSAAPGRHASRRRACPAPGTALSPAPSRLTAFDSAALARLRRAQGSSQGQIARDSGVSVATIKRLEREHDPACRTRTITFLAAALGHPPDTLHRQAANQLAAITRPCCSHSAPRRQPASRPRHRLP